MTGVIAEIDIDVPPGRVWELIEDPHCYADIADPTQRMIDVPDEPVDVGYVYKEYGGIKPFLSESTWTVTEWTPPMHTVHIGDDGSTEMRLTIDITETPSGGSHIRQELDMHPRWWMTVPNAVLWPLMLRKRAQVAMDKTVANVKRMAESN